MNERRVTSQAQEEGEQSKDGTDLNRGQDRTGASAASPSSSWKGTVGQASYHAGTPISGARPAIPSDSTQGSRPISLNALGIKSSPDEELPVRSRHNSLSRCSAQSVSDLMPQTSQSSLQPASQPRSETALEKKTADSHQQPCGSGSGSFRPASAPGSCATQSSPTPEGMDPRTTCPSASEDEATRESGAMFGMFDGRFGPTSVKGNDNMIGVFCRKAVDAFLTSRRKPHQQQQQANSRDEERDVQPLTPTALIETKTTPFSLVRCLGSTLVDSLL